MWSDALISAFNYLISVIPPIVIGIVLMELMIELGWIHKLDFVTTLFMRFARLRPEVADVILKYGNPFVE